MEEDERRPPREITLPRPLAGLSVAELEAYTVMLKDEIKRVQAELDRQRQVKGAAEALFRPRP